LLQFETTGEKFELQEKSQLLDRAQKKLKNKSRLQTVKHKTIFFFKRDETATSVKFVLCKFCTAHPELQLYPWEIGLLAIHFIFKSF
jgi:hypothetical protein